ncbi:hypothetical protein I3843_Q016000 [Carya illinoinensis]|nr:hypothetical protein I3843_Q016000 [Carya illinoinensis]KAG6671090.1 hypothetical protein I3843_Q016000 [Carya illinoinensis]KAG6671091.1 hypothetical protein I3843_Q016000 [Carya illinoinensis]KAG6671092.1 hypothetical protein I3843_Q016000 [Carya illinoinensis]KAG6671093.1 hypothetical protein I3843_Q016000 [Carya illinoinensis]
MGLQLGVGGKQYSDQRLTTSYVVESDTFGRDEDKKKVIDLLLPSDVGGNEMGNEKCVIAIVGMGGLGKTTLAKLVYNERRVEQHFDLKIWICVLEEFDVPKIKKSIIDQVATSSARKTEDPEQLQVTVQKNLNGKKFLLVLDDVWSENPIHEEFLGQLLQYGTRGSKILVTTRNDSVALAMHAEPHHLTQLPVDDCQSLFEKHAFRNGSSNVDLRIKEIGTKIVKKCKGLPLAIKAIGNLLQPESDVERWTNILKSHLWDISMEETNILPALRLSYKYLPSNLKRCFAYCSILPKGYIFEKDKLVLLWMAEGFLQQTEIETMEKVGNRYFHALVSRSLFQQSSEGFVMHDLVNDLAKFVAGQFGTDSFKKIVKMTRYVSCSDQGIASFKKIVKMTRYVSCSNQGIAKFHGIEDDLLKAKQLRTFLALYTFVVDIKIPRAILHLRVLSLGGKMWDITELPDSIGKMKYLRYLDVSNSNIKRLPNSICNLCNLQTLKLSGCRKLERLPRDMWKLINLRHLEIDETWELIKEMPIQMGRLKCLQTLSKFIISKHSRSRIGELGKLINLRGKLLIEELQHVRSADDALAASLKDKAHLEQLVLQWSPPKEFGILENQRCVLENLQPHENLRSLTINEYGGNGFSNWIGQGLPSLSILKLRNCKYCCDLPPLGHLHSLNELYIYGLDEVVTVGPEFYGNSSNSSMKPFGTLKVLHLVNMLNWEDWLHSGGENEVETFSQLEELYIKNCPKLRAKLLVHPSSLAKLVIIKCKKLELPMHWQYSSLEKLYLRDCCDSLMSFPLDLFPNLKSVQIKGSNNLQSLEQHGGDHLVISKLRIRKCPKFVDFPKGGLRTSNLANFIINDCESLRSMPDKMHLFLPSLCYLELRNCPEVESFPEGGLPFNLKQIVIRRCKKLIANWKGWDLQILPSLEWLEIVSDKLEDHVESFPGGLLLPTTLTNLKISSFGNLKSLDDEGFQHLTSLEELHLNHCPNLRYMPKEGFPTSLHVLKLQNFDSVLKEELERKEGEEWLKVARVPNMLLDDVRIQGNYLRLVLDMNSPYGPPYDQYEYEDTYYESE